LGYPDVRVLGQNDTVECQNAGMHSCISPLNTRDIKGKEKRYLWN